MDPDFFDDSDPAPTQGGGEYTIPPGDDHFGVDDVDDEPAGLSNNAPALGSGGLGGGYSDLDAMNDVEADSGPSALDVFLAKWEVTLEEKRKVELEKKRLAVETAREELLKFAEEREILREKKQSRNRTEEQVKLEQLEADLESDNPWERVVNLVDMQTDTKSDLGRMKQIFIQLKNENWTESSLKSNEIPAAI